MTPVYTHIVVKELMAAGFTEKQAEVLIKWFVIREEPIVGV